MSGNFTLLSDSDIIGNIFCQLKAIPFEKPEVGGGEWKPKFNINVGEGVHERLKISKNDKLVWGSSMKNICGGISDMEDSFG